jgi:hypothetical protein
MAIYKCFFKYFIISLPFIFIMDHAAAQSSYSISGTDQPLCYSQTGAIIDCSNLQGHAVSLQHRHANSAPIYRDNADGTVSDRSTGLMWTKARSAPMPFSQLTAYAANNRTGGYDDWRVPTIKELYSLIIFSGGYTGDPSTSRPYIDQSMFEFSYGSGTGLGSAEKQKRPIDVQEWSSTQYIGRTMGHDKSVFGVNFADGRIKAYPIMDPSNQMKTPHQLSVRLVRGSVYGINAFILNPHSVIDQATGLEWQRRDDGKSRNWVQAHTYCRQLQLNGHTDWRLPTAKELHSIVDYQKIPAIYSVFSISDRHAYLWSSTTHLEAPPSDTIEKAPFKYTGELAIYAAIGPAMGWVELPIGSGKFRWLDAHGAGAMRSDPKVIPPNEFPEGFGPQRDDVRGYNYVLCVRVL